MFQGDQLSSVETTTVFFGVTKLFQSTNQNLRRMMYLFIKEVAETCNPDDVIIVTSSLTKVCLAASPPSSLLFFLLFAYQTSIFPFTTPPSLLSRT